MLRHAVHGSGSPVPWDIERRADHRELLALVHAGHGASAHWAARIDRATHCMTHISAGPVLRSAEFYTKVRDCDAASAVRRAPSHAQRAMQHVFARVLCGRDRAHAVCTLPICTCYNETMVRGGQRLQASSPADLVVGSFHVIDKLGEDGATRAVRRCHAPSCPHLPGPGRGARGSRASPASRSQVRILHGDSVSFGCWLDVPADTIAWHALSSPGAGIASARHARPPLAPLSLQRPHCLACTGLDRCRLSCMCAQVRAAPTSTL